RFPRAHCSSRCLINDLNPQAVERAINLDIERVIGHEYFHNWTAGKRPPSANYKGLPAHQQPPDRHGLKAVGESCRGVSGLG
ncbi:hypothetical protein OS119_27500, partial [Klebsiella pneumoniae]|uniref:hypothetical protein n=1 Tax=Klebsiella pneumoniae TaxID=573 RepID=UPI00237B395F